MEEHSNTEPPGYVYLVGAGPGNPKLITLRGVECLQQADVILYDYLVNSQILELASPHAERICLGHHGGSRIWPQNEINQRLVALARDGKTVVRLKAGDPMVFARVAEETDLLLRERIPYEIVPGITAALAAGSYAGVPLTHRNMASAVALITGQEKAGKDHSSLDFDALARFPGTLVFYMGVTTAERWTKALIAAGKPAETPVTIVRRCSFPDQVTIRCRLEEVARKIAAPTAIRPPAIVIVGDVSGTPQALRWFEQRPLFGQTVMITRPQTQCGDLSDRLSSLGANVVVHPAISIAPPPNWDPVDRAIRDIDTYNWLVFSSRNGVQYFLNRLIACQRDLRSLGGVRLAAIGPGTRDALAEYHLRADLVPEEYRAEALAESLAAAAAGRRFLLTRASRGREVLAEGLMAAGAHVDQVVCYESTDVATVEPQIQQALAKGQVDWVTVTSSAIARSLVAVLGDDLRQARLVSISPVTSATLRKLGFEPAVEAREYTMDGIVSAILARVANQSP
jgi:uroporphyrinogen III methyltransferase/synthase